MNSRGVRLYDFVATQSSLHLFRCENGSDACLDVVDVFREAGAEGLCVKVFLIGL